MTSRISGDYDVCRAEFPVELTLKSSRLSTLNFLASLRFDRTIPSNDSDDNWPSIVFSEKKIHGSCTPRQAGNADPEILRDASNFAPRLMNIVLENLYRVNKLCHRFTVLDTACQKIVRATKKW